jgi:hypothetical protein
VFRFQAQLTRKPNTVDDPTTRVRTVLEAVLDALESQAVLLGALADRVPAADQAEALRPVRARITVLDRPPISREAFVEDLTRIVLDLTYRPAAGDFTTATVTSCDS